MSWDINKWIGIGRLASDVELRTTPNGKHVANFRIAVGGGEFDGKEKVSFLSVVAWGKTAEVCEKYLSKGKQVAVEGHLEQRQWETQDGSKRSIVEIIIDRVEFIGSKSDEKKKDDEPKGQQWTPSNDQPEIDYKSLNDDDMPFKNLDKEDDIPY